MRFEDGGDCTAPWRLVTLGTSNTQDTGIPLDDFARATAQGIVEWLQLRDLLELQTVRFVQDERYHEYFPSETRFRASPLLRQYRDDIERDYTTLWSFIQHFAKADIANALDLRPTKIVWLDFDKRLNDDPSAPGIQPAQ